MSKNKCKYWWLEDLSCSFYFCPIFCWLGTSCFLTYGVFTFLPQCVLAFKQSQSSWWVEKKTQCIGLINSRISKQYFTRHQPHFTRAHIYNKWAEVRQRLLIRRFNALATQKKVMISSLLQLHFSSQTNLKD